MFYFFLNFFLCFQLKLESWRFETRGSKSVDFCECVGEINGNGDVDEDVDVDVDVDGDNNPSL